jgi:hypothetical protein
MKNLSPKLIITCFFLFFIFTCINTWAFYFFPNYHFSSTSTISSDISRYLNTTKSIPSEGIESSTVVNVSTPISISNSIPLNDTVWKPKDYNFFLNRYFFSTLDNTGAFSYDNGSVVYQKKLSLPLTSVDQLELLVDKSLDIHHVNLIISNGLSINTKTAQYPPSPPLKNYLKEDGFNHVYIPIGDTLPLYFSISPYDFFANQPRIRKLMAIEIIVFAKLKAGFSDYPLKPLHSINIFTGTSYQIEIKELSIGDVLSSLFFIILLIPFFGFVFFLFKILLFCLINNFSSQHSHDTRFLILVYFLILFFISIISTEFVFFENFLTSLIWFILIILLLYKLILSHKFFANDI